MRSAVQKPFPKASQDEDSSVIVGYNLKSYSIVCFWVLHWNFPSMDNIQWTSNYHGMRCK